AAHPFVGRGPELARLRGAFARARAGESVVVPVTGPSGIGKTALIRQFLGALGPGDAMVLAGRCHDRELVPYPAIESMIDALALELLARPRAEAEALIPHNVAALARLFPTLRRVPAIAEPPVPGLVPRDQAELRRRAVGACADLIQALAGDRVPVMFLDDMQWSGDDTNHVLGELVRYFVGVGALFIVTSRPSEAPGPAPTADGSDTQPLADVAFPSGRSLSVVIDLALGPLDDGAATELLRALGAPDAVGSPDDSGGIPFLLLELARHRGRVDAPAIARSLDDVLAERLAALAPAGRAFLDACAVAPGPIPLAVAAAIAGGDALAVLTGLCSERLVAGGKTRGEWYVEPYHDRIRTAILRALAPARRAQLHAHLAAAMEELPGASAAELVAHWRAAGDPVRAAHHAQIAARAAEASLAFHHAAAMYRIALEAPLDDADARRGLERQLAACLANSGQLEAAIAALVRAGADATGAERHALKRLEIEYVLRIGELRRGLADAYALCAELGGPIATGRTAIAARVVRSAIARRVRGTAFTPRHEDAIAPRQLELIDALWSLTSGLLYVDPALSRLTQLHHLAEALRGGEPYRVARALCLELPYVAHGGTAALVQTAALEARIRTLVDELARPDVMGLFDSAAGVAAAISGRWAEARARCTRAEAALRDHCTGMRWTLSMAQFYRLAALWYLGDTAELVDLTPRYLAEAEQLGDVHALGGLRVGKGNVYWLVIDRPIDARAMAAAGFPSDDHGDDVHLHDYFRATALAQIDLYEGDGAAALARVERFWPALERTRLPSVQLIRIEAELVFARAAIAAAAQGVAPDRNLALARQRLQRLARVGAPWVQPLTGLLEGRIAALRDDAVGARAHLERAATLAATHQLALVGLAARIAGDRLEPGAPMAAAHAAELGARGVVNPAALLRVLGAA
ncbi:MAG: AAA family ATPase, partial [Deltaproteobacteria bacterium]|nr:AAA family ATPase [Deltaproteobacteria bacterium]